MNLTDKDYFTSTRFPIEWV